MFGELKVFSGRSNLELAGKICKKLGIKLGELTIKQFSDGELWVKFEDNIRGKDIFIIQPTNSPHENIIELLLILDAARRASAGRITAVLPYYGYARQDRKDQPRVPISARLFMDLIVNAGAQRIISMDLHSTQIQGYVNVPFDHLYSKPAFMNYLQKSDLADDDNLVIVAPDVGSVPLARSYANALNKDLAIIDKRRTEHNKCEVMHVIGNVKNKRVLIMDDMADTAGTLVSAAQTLLKMGAKEVNASFTHAVLSGPAIVRIKNSDIKKIIVTDTIHRPESKTCDKIDTITISDVFADAIDRIHHDKSVSMLFNKIEI
ncbi:MAG: ribose-phosphate pyrophosphokinase [Candidatus Marinimicrobia bacterium]|nr:ribose-phosphate pyrophosphokinase [Candidatus Neomarinimicrobiota bacterium]